MAKPNCTSLDVPPADVVGTVVLVRDQNWQQGLGNGDRLIEPRYVKSWSIDGGRTWGIPGPPRSSDPAIPVPGQVPPGMTAFDFRGLIPAGHTKEILFEIAAGTHSRYQRADGSVAYDVIEWGNRFLTLDDSGAPVRFTVMVTHEAEDVPTDPVPTPVQSINVGAMRQTHIEDMIPLFKQWKTNGKTLDDVRGLRYPRVYELLVEGIPGRPNFAQLWSSL